MVYFNNFGNTTKDSENDEELPKKLRTDKEERLRMINLSLSPMRRWMKPYKMPSKLWVRMTRQKNEKVEGIEYRCVLLSEVTYESKVQHTLHKKANQFLLRTVRQSFTEMPHDILGGHSVKFHWNLSRSQCCRSLSQKIEQFVKSETLCRFLS